MKGRRMLKSAVVVVVALVLGVAVGRLWDLAPTSTTTTTTTANVTTTLPAQPREAIWPQAWTPTRFATPLLAAQTFALDYLGFSDLVVEPFQRGDSRSGEVPIRSSLSGVRTTVLVRQVSSDDTWWVIGAVSPNLLVSTPSALTAITNPVRVEGTSTAYEGVVNVEVRQDANLSPLVRTTVRGGSMGVMGPFSASIAYKSSTSTSGAIVLFTRSAKDGSVLEASVLRVSFKK